MTTVGEAMAEGYDQLVVYWSEPTRHGTERTTLSGVSIGTDLKTWASSFAKGAGHATITPGQASRGLESI